MSDIRISRMRCSLFPFQRVGHLQLNKDCSAHHNRVPEISTHLCIWRWVDWNAYRRRNWGNGRDGVCKPRSLVAVTDEPGALVSAVAVLEMGLQSLHHGPSEGKGHQWHCLLYLGPSLCCSSATPQESLVTTVEVFHVTPASWPQQCQQPQGTRQQQW